MRSFAEISPQGIVLGARTPAATHRATDEVFSGMVWAMARLARVVGVDVRTM
jgi:hypothetical protein